MAMIDNSLREVLYPLGFLASLAFGARFILQWIKSEIKQKSIVTPIFWKLSLVGNVLLFFHSFIQLQFHVCVIQVVNGVISWRNLNLNKDISKRYKTKSVIVLLFALLALTCLLFLFMQFVEGLSFNAWFRVPTSSWGSNPSSVSFAWHLFGFAGLALFNSRFWIQWWHAEKTQTSTISRSFWWISLIGAFAALIYFVHIRDFVNIIGPGIGIIPYIRNLMLLSKSKSIETAAEQA